MEAATKLPPLVKVVGTIAEIIPAPAANRSGRVVLTDGKKLGAFADKLTKLNVGGTYDFGCTKKVVDGVAYFDVKTWRPAAALEPDTTSQPAATHGKKMDQQFYRPTSPEDKQSMFRCAMMTAFVHAGQVRIDREEIARAIVEIDAGYEIAINHPAE